MNELRAFSPPLAGRLAIESGASFLSVFSPVLKLQLSAILSRKAIQAGDRKRAASPYLKVRQSKTTIRIDLPEDVRHSLTYKRFAMPRMVRGGLIQATLCEPATSPVEKIKRAMIDIHSHLVPQSLWRAAEAGREWYGITHEPGPGLGTMMVNGKRTGFASPKVNRLPMGSSPGK